MTPSTQRRAPFDPDAVHEKYRAERARRMVVERPETVDLADDERFSGYLTDPFTASTPRAPVIDDVDVVIVGAGLSG